MFGLYLHIPYCPSKCSYCDFYSIGKKTCVPDEYVDMLINQIWQFSPCGSTPLRPDTVYFGGGTPSLLSPEQIAKILSATGCMPNGEITLEANPDTLTLDKLKSFRQAGINRISVGVQTANNESLKTLSRGHTAEQSLKSLLMCTEAGFTNISGDLMLALPNYTFAECDNTIKLLSDGGCTHVSSYLLKIEERTPFHIHPPVNLPDEDMSSDFYLYAVDALEKQGYSQYEISNFSKKGFESKHNLIYWNCGDYLGIGPSAHSCINNKRFFQTPNLKEFLSKPSIVQDGESTVDDYIMLQLRLNAGLDLKKLNSKYTYEFTKQKIDFMKKCEDAKLCVFDNDIIKLTPRGMLLQNSILTEIL